MLKWLWKVLTSAPLSFPPPVHYLVISINMHPNLSLSLSLRHPPPPHFFFFFFFERLNDTFGLISLLIPNISGTKAAQKWNTENRHRLASLRVTSDGCSCCSFCEWVVCWNGLRGIGETHIYTPTGSVTVAFGTQLINSNTSPECVNRALYCTFSNKMLLSFFWQAVKKFVIIMAVIWLKLV